MTRTGNFRSILSRLRSTRAQSDTPFDIFASRLSDEAGKEET
jgi:hypothetical protein